MRSLRSAFWIQLKAALFLAAGMIAISIILVEYPAPRLALLLGIALWAFCRAYYFAFYVISKYLDPHFRFSGLGSALYWLIRQGRP